MEYDGVNIHSLFRLIVLSILKVEIRTFILFYSLNYKNWRQLNLFSVGLDFTGKNTVPLSRYISALDFCNSAVCNIQFDEQDFFLI